MTLVLTDDGPISIARLHKLLEDYRDVGGDITALTEAGSVDQAADYVAIYDASGAVAVKVKLVNLGF